MMSDDKFKLPWIIGKSVVPFYMGMLPLSPEHFVPSGPPTKTDLARFSQESGFFYERLSFRSWRIETTCMKKANGATNPGNRI